MFVPNLDHSGDSGGIVPFEVSGERSHETIFGKPAGGHRTRPARHHCATHAAAFNKALPAFLTS